jgi:mono/diheme cytochrome c family protein
MRAMRILFHFAAAALLAALAPIAARADAQSSQTESELIARGEYLTKAADCASCHTNPGGKPFAGGRSFALPVGVLYAPNITPDPQTGIGGYSDDDWVRMLHDGVGRGGKHLYPAMPYPEYTQMTRDDALAVKAYLMSLAPVQATIPPNQLRFPFNQRWTMIFWNLVNNPGRRFQADSSKPAEYNRGDYLTSALGHCGECHTPRNFMMSLKSGKQFAGGEQVGWHAYNLTSDRTSGLGGWTDAALEQYLSTGHADGHGPASGPMAEAVSYSLRYLKPEDIHAVVTYLRGVPAQPDGPPAVQSGGTPAAQAAGTPATQAAGTPAAQAAGTPAAQAAGTPEAQAAGMPLAPADPMGPRLFEQACAGCHLPDGSGRQSPWAALRGSHSAGDPAATNLVQVLTGGTQIETSQGVMFMHPFTGGYTDEELASVANYVQSQFGFRKGAVAPEQIRKQRHGPEPVKSDKPSS